MIDGRALVAKADELMTEKIDGPKLTYKVEATEHRAPSSLAALAGWWMDTANEPGRWGAPRGRTVDPKAKIRKKKRQSQKAARRKNRRK